MNTCYKLEYNSTTNKYTIKPLGSNWNVDRSKVNGVLQLSNYSWVARHKQELVDHAENMVKEQIEKYKRIIARLEEREIIY